MKINSVLLKTLAPLFLLTSCSAQTSIKEPPQQAPNQTHNQTLDIVSEQDFASIESTQHEDIWQRIVSNYQLDLSVNNPRTTAQLNWYKSHQAYLDRVADRGVRYLHFIAEQIEARDVPGELALLPIVESAFEPFAYSFGRASGVWQFIPSTGKMFGLKQDWWHDGRRDIRASTEAALSYLEALQREFDGDWLLALAAYNSGGGTVRKAIRLNKSQGKPTDFWSLKLPKETQDYVPKLIALAQLVQNPEQYGVKLAPIPDEPYFAVAKTGGQIDLALIADLADTPIDEIYKLNPSYNRWATHPDGPHEVLIPVSQIELFNQQIAELPVAARIKWQRYVVKSGDTLISIAQKHQTTPQVIIDTNDIKGSIIRPNDQLLIPNSLLSQEQYSQSSSQRLQRIVSQRQPANTQRIDYYVKSGDTLWDIARTHKVNVSNLARWNGMAPRDPIHAGQKLVIWSKSTSASPASRQVVRKVDYRVRAGDSLAGISQKFNVRLADIKRWNTSQASQKYLQPGQQLTLYVDVTR